MQASSACDLIGLLNFSPGTEWRPCIGSLIPNNRTLLVHEAVKAGASHILFIDSDMRFPHDTLARLLAHGKDIVAANYRQRTRPELFCSWDGDWVTSVGRSGLQKVESCGFGVMLVDVNVFTSPLRAVPPDSFATPFNAEGIFDGEDVNFCREARKAGFGVWIDHDLSREVKHSAMMELGVDG